MSSTWSVLTVLVKYYVLGINANWDYFYDHVWPLTGILFKIFPSCMMTTFVSSSRRNFLCVI